MCHLCVSVCLNARHVRLCVHACVRVCVHLYVCACVRTYVCAVYVCVSLSGFW